jgi:hypothetical protein
MSENQQPNHDLLEEAIHAFQRMSVPERPLDAEVLAQFVPRHGDLARQPRTPIPPKRRYFKHALLSSMATAVLLLGGLALFSRKGSPPESFPVATTGSPGKGRDVAVQPAPGKEYSQRESLGRHGLARDVADAQAIVVATALESTPAPPNRPGDLPETLIRFRVKRVLKGKLNDREILTRTPNAAGEFIGNDWIILLSPGYMAGKYQYASHVNVMLEPTVKAILSTDKK